MSWIYEKRNYEGFLSGFVVQYSSKVTSTGGVPRLGLQAQFARRLN